MWYDILFFDPKSVKSGFYHGELCIEKTGVSFCDLLNCLVFDLKILPLYRHICRVVFRLFKRLLPACRLACLSQKQRNGFREAPAPEETAGNALLPPQCCQERKPRQGLNGARHVFDDDLAETAEEQDSLLPPPVRHRATAIAFAINGILLFILSAL